LESIRFLLVTVILLIAIPMVINPMQRPEGMLRDYILRMTPIGTSIDDVIEVARSRDD